MQLNMTASPDPMRLVNPDHPEHMLRASPAPTAFAQEGCWTAQKSLHMKRQHPSNHGATAGSGFAVPNIAASIPKAEHIWAMMVIAISVLQNKALY